MLERIRDGRRVVGTNRVAKAIAADLVREVYLAQDADIFITRKIGDLCAAHRVPVVDAPSMRALGEACGVDVPTASAGLLK